MAVRENTEALTFLAGADFSQKQFHFVKLNATPNTIVPCVAGDRSVGVIQNNPNGDPEVASEVDVSGRTKVVAGGSITANADISSDADGAAITAILGHSINGKALTSAEDGELVEVLLGYGGEQA